MPADLPKLYLARHGDTAWTDSHRHAQVTFDSPLDLRAHAQMPSVLRSDRRGQFASWRCASD
jgi:hypothetical protein